MAVVGQRVAAAEFDSSDLYSSEWERYLCKRGIFGLFREKNPPPRGVIATRGQIQDDPINEIGFCDILEFYFI